jgi:hypothetical protein
MLQRRITRQRIIRSGEEMPCPCPHLADPICGARCAKFDIKPAGLTAPAIKKTQKKFFDDADPGSSKAAIPLRKPHNPASGL